ncbi:hypothetical protein ABZ845_14940 [Streptomyces sp. NPDC047022]
MAAKSSYSRDSANRLMAFQYQLPPPLPHDECPEVGTSSTRTTIVGP